jgi:hypothetical protein
MTPQERERMELLCKRIQVEQDQKVFNELILELTALLAKKDTRLQHSGTSKQ